MQEVCHVVDPIQIEFTGALGWIIFYTRQGGGSVDEMRWKTWRENTVVFILLVKVKDMFSSKMNRCTWLVLELASQSRS